MDRDFSVFRMALRQVPCVSLVKYAFFIILL